MSRFWRVLSAGWAVGGSLFVLERAGQGSAGEGVEWVMQLKHYAGAGEVLMDGAHFCWVQYSLRLDQETAAGEPKLSGEITISTDEQLTGDVFKMEAGREYTLVLADKITSRRVTLVSDDPIRGVWQLIFHPGQAPL